MSTSTLDPDNSFEQDRQLGLAHDNATLGPSDTSDSGSDVAGNGLAEELGIRSPHQLFDLDGELSTLDLDQESASDTDASGTGERAGVDPVNVRTGQDIGIDRIGRLDEIDQLSDHEDIGPIDPDTSMEEDDE